MVKVNLIGKKRRESKNKNWVVVVMGVLFVGFIVYFLATVVYVVFQLNSLNAELLDVEERTRSLSAQMVANNQLLNRYVLSKFILGKIQSTNKSKFRYKDYLDQINGLMPSSVNLKNVDFSIPGWVSVLASAENISSLKTLERSVTDPTQLNRSFFSSVFTENVTKDKKGAYNARLQFEIRKNGGN